MLRKVKFIFIMFCAIFLNNLVLAHDFWIEKRENKFYIFSGHEGVTEGYDPKRVVKWIILNSRGERLPLSIVKGKELAYFEGQGRDIGLIVVFFDNKYWVKTTEGWKNIGKREASEKGFHVLESGRSYKFAKYLNKWNKKFTKPLGTEIEVVPLNNPFKSDTIKVQVLLRGKVLSEAPIFLNASHEEGLKTDKEGIAEVYLRRGLNIISVTTRVPLEKDPEGDLVYLRASLSFFK
ncbi:MAG: DUF4198 domain-containing protein [Thermodesulfovibrio sp.]|nr:DUF4198 domain-containing protein [Thermodesulfovibrio sp.]